MMATKRDDDGSGMSLRDWLAGQALAGVSAPIMASASAANADPALVATNIAKVAYILADAMLAARRTSFLMDEIVNGTDEPTEDADDPMAGFENCPACGGSGLAHNMAGEPDVCRTCMGNTVVRTTSTP